jgi:hypothetical protein
LKEIYIHYYKHELLQLTLSFLTVKRALEKMVGRVHVKTTLKIALMKETMVFRKKEVWRTYGGLTNLTTTSTSIMQSSRRGKKMQRAVRGERHRGEEGKDCKERGGYCTSGGLRERAGRARCMQAGRRGACMQRRLIRCPSGSAG